QRVQPGRPAKATKTRGAPCYSKRAPGCGCYGWGKVGREDARTAHTRRGAKKPGVWAPTSTLNASEGTPPVTKPVRFLRRCVLPHEASSPSRTSTSRPNGGVFYCLLGYGYRKLRKLSGSLAQQTRLAKAAQRRLHPVGGACRGRHRIESLESVTRVEQHGFGSRVQMPGGDQLLQHGRGHPTGGLAENSGGAAQQLDTLTDLVIVRGLHPAAGAAYRRQRVRPGGRVADVERLGDAGRLHGRDLVDPFVQRGGDRRAAGGLGTVH